MERMGYYPHFIKEKKSNQGNDFELHPDSPTTLGTQGGPYQKSCFIHVIQTPNDFIYDTNFAEEYIDLLFGFALLLL